MGSDGIGFDGMGREGWNLERMIFGGMEGIGVKRIWKGFGVLKEGDRKGIRMEKLTNLKVYAIGRYVVFFDFIMVLSIFTLLITVFIAFLKIVN